MKLKNLKFNVNLEITAEELEVPIENSHPAATKSEISDIIDMLISKGFVDMITAKFSTLENSTENLETETENSAPQASDETC